MSTQNLLAVYNHELFRNRVKLLIGEAALLTMTNDPVVDTPEQHADRSHAAYDCLVEKVPLETIVKLILANPSFKTLASNDGNGTGENIPDNDIVSFLLTLLYISAPMNKVRREANY